MSSRAFFVSDDDQFAPTALARGPWGQTISGNYVGGLLGHVAERVEELRQLEKQLRSLRDTCRITRDSAHCGILKGLTEGAPQQSVGKGGAARHIHGAHKSGRS